MDWQPNVDGIRWFVADILPASASASPHAASPSPAAAQTRPFAKLRATIRTSPSVPVVGLRIGGGTHLKILEAMAARVPVVSTSIGAEGLDVSSGRNIWITDTPEDFADRSLELLTDPTARCRMASAAWKWWPPVILGK
jgi:hypothetical protein